MSDSLDPQDGTNDYDEPRRVVRGFEDDQFAPEDSREVVGRAGALEAAAILRETIAKKPRFEDGTVVRWTVREGSATYAGGGIRFYTYVAVFVNDQWYLTAQNRSQGFEKSMTSADLMEALSSPKVGSVEVATQWTTV